MLIPAGGVQRKNEKEKVRGMEGGGGAMGRGQSPSPLLDGLKPLDVSTAFPVSLADKQTSPHRRLKRTFQSGIDVMEKGDHRLQNPNFCEFRAQTSSF